MIRLTRAALRVLMPATVKAAVHGVRYRLSGCPADGFRQAAQLEGANRTRSAVKVWRRLLESHPTDQQTCFKAGRHLWRLKMPTVHDQLFACAVSEARSGPGVLAFGVEFTYAGLWVLMRLDRKHGKGGQAISDVVHIRLGDTMLRRHRLEWHDDVATFQFIVKREVVSLFPPRGCLSIAFHDPETGDVGTLASALVEVPHGKSHLADQVALRGMLEKKGGLPPAQDDLTSRQRAYLDLYWRASRIFEDKLDCKLFVLYGTLLGLQRNGDFIPGDDDFDVGYVSDAVAPREVKREAARFIRILAHGGFKVSLNRIGRPFRLSDADAPEGIHLDVRPVWSPGDGHVWMHKHARLPMSLDGFRKVEKGFMEGEQVWKPVATITFLELYYGSGWKVPDPGFSNSGKQELKEEVKILQECCFSSEEQLQLWREVVGPKPVTLEQSVRSRFAPIALLPAYPLREP